MTTARPWPTARVAPPRPPGSSAGDDLVTLLDDITRDVDPGNVAPYRTRPKVLADIVREGEGGHYRAHGRRQFNAMRHQPMVSVPERFWGRV